MIIYIVSMSTTQGPTGPTVNMTYHRDHQDALDEFTECMKNLTEDPSTVLLVKVDGETMTNTILQSFEGTEEDYMDQWGQDYEDDQEG
jgi:hypothetical protein